MAGILVFARRAKLNVLAFFDVLAVPLLIAHAIGRVGCLLNGCCYGRPTDAWYGVHVEQFVGLHQPAQIFDSVMVLVGAAFIVLYERKVRPMVATTSESAVWTNCRDVDRHGTFVGQEAAVSRTVPQGGNVCSISKILWCCYSVTRSAVSRFHAPLSAVGGKAEVAR